MYDANKEERDILEFWKKNKTFEKSVESRPEDKPYVFYDGPPFATGLPHYGHILSSVIKDVVPRYWTMKGYRVRRRWGWDCHGLPIENIVEKELGISGKKDIERMGVDVFNATSREKVLTYAAEWKDMVDRIGRWVEFDNAYKTMDPTYMESVWWALKTIWDKGLIYEGRKVLMYCPRCETPVSKAEVAMDHTYIDVTEEAVTVKFKVTSHKSHTTSHWKSIKGPLYILAWTTTPWTLPGNVALAVKPDILYSLVKHDDAQYLVAKDRLMHVFGGKEFKVIEQIRGKELIGLEYEPIFDVPAVRAVGKKAWYVADANFVTTDEGTGIVHTAVVYGEDDYALGLEKDLPVVPLLDEKGHFNADAPEIVRGKYFKASEKILKDDLEARGLLFARERHTHSYPHCWRCETQLYYNAISAWFINIQKIKPRLVALNEKINWYPEHLKHGRFLNIVETAPDWNISRNRYWATPLPFWRCTNVRTTKDTKLRNTKEACGNVVCVGSIKELKEKAINFDEVYQTDSVEQMDLHKHLMDKIKLRCNECGGEMTRIPEVIDCWVESASMPFAEFHYPFENKDIFEKRFPAQYIAEYIAQTRAWFYYLHALAVLLFDNISAENVVTTGTILNEKGEKLSKSKRNYTDPSIIIEKYGVDALRYYLMTSVVMEADNLFFKDEEVRDAYNKVVNLLWNVFEFYGMFSEKNPKSDPPAGGRNPQSKHVLDRWILARLNQLVKEVTHQMDQYDTVRAGRPIKEFIDDLSTWYVRRSRDRFKGNVRTTNEDEHTNYEQGAQAAIATLREVLLTLSKIMAPFMPFMAEKIYQSITSHEPHTTSQFAESVHLETWPRWDEKMIDQELFDDMAKARKVVELGLALRKEAGIKVRQPLSKFSIFNFQFSKELSKIIAEELNVKEIIEEEVRGDDWKIKEEGDLKVALNTNITDELKKEGLAREIVRAVNQTRKEKGLTREDRIAVYYQTTDAMANAVFKEYAEDIKAGALADSVEVGEGGTRVAISDAIVLLRVGKK